MTRRALVTGAEGFVGGILCRRLERAGWEVFEGVLASPAHPRQKACDITEPGQVRELLAWAGPVTHVFHLAALTFVPESIEHPERAMRINFEGTLHVLDAARASADGARVVYVGSAEVYGKPRDLPITEEHPLDPENPYAVSKMAADLHCRYLHRAEGLDIVRMRPFNHSGPGQSDQFVLSSFARQIARIEAGLAEPVVRVGNLSAARDFLHVDDVVRAYELAALGGRGGEAYNVCAGRAVSISSALDGLIVLSGARIAVEVDERLLRPVDVPEVVGAHDRLTADTGWTPEIPFERLLSDLLDYWRGKVSRNKRG